ncbi:NYN domain-containing protein [Lucifera butyrica]|nr:NYN domain-containing protein [Lucifera butyrica]
MYQERLIVDGYNVINAWPELIALKNENLEHARDKLTDMLASYGAYKDFKVTLVFDAHAVPGGHCAEETASGVDVIYTKEGETADSYIEKMVYYLVRSGARVYVVTSDWAEQMAVLGSGAYRVSARELRLDVLETAKKIREGYVESPPAQRRREIGNRLNRDLLQRLDEIRRRR